ncbi:MAG: hypothetical protein CYG60_26030 [Actinobacteria bacterium]|nr:MAG: hypothetical protein CYG60_26030 [Actinomycetota bacterium]
MTATNDDGGGPKPALPSRWQVAIHEAAHAVYARSRARIVTRVSVEGIVAIENGAERDGPFGRCRCDGEAEVAFDGLAGCVFSLVGPAAAFRADWPEPLLPYPEFVRDAEARNPRSDAGRVIALLRSADDPEGLYEAARSEAEAFVEERWADIVRLAERLMESESLDEEAIELVFDPTWPEFQKMLDELADDRCPWFIAEQEAEGEGDE